MNAARFIPRWKLAKCGLLLLPDYSIFDGTPRKKAAIYPVPANLPLTSDARNIAIICLH
jgi:hypothetical protein